MIKFIYTFFILTLSSLCLSQEITGSIKSEDDESIPFCTVFLKNEKKTVRSNITGLYNIKLDQTSTPHWDTIVVSYIGYETEKKPVLIVSNDTLILNINLKRKFQLIDEQIVKGLKLMAGEDIVLKAIKNQKNNYIDRTIVADGFYRELSSENESWVQLNEASIKIKYSKYPQRFYLKEAFKAYIKKDELPWNIYSGSIFLHMLRFPSFLPIDSDQISINSSRVSFDLSKTGIDVAPVGGPGDLLALDKLKFQNDFFDKKIMKKYVYKVTGQKYVQDELCYVINFYPREELKERIFQSAAERMNYAIYCGQIIISGSSFSVVNFEFELASSLDFSIYKDNYGIPSVIKGKVEYVKHNGKWIINKVNTEQKVYKNSDYQKNEFISKREFQVFTQSIFQKNINFCEDSIVYITKTFQLRKQSKSYDEKYWLNFEKTKEYPAIPNAVKSDLEKLTLLSEQFSFLNIPLDSITAPLAEKKAITSVYFEDTIVDNYQWQETPDSSTLAYLKRENEYFNSAVFKINDFSKSFLLTYNNIFEENDESEKSAKKTEFNLNNGVKFRFKQDENGNTGLYKLSVLDSTEVLILNYTKLISDKINFFLEKIKFSNSEILAYSYSEKGGYTKTLEISGDSTYQINEIGDFEWLNDSVLIYTKHDSFKNCIFLYSFDIKNNKETLLYKESDKAYRIELRSSISGDYLFIISQSLFSNEYQIIKRSESEVSLKLFLKREVDHFYELEHKNAGNNIYGISNKNNHSEIFRVSTSEPKFESKTVIYNSKNTIDDFEETKSFISFKEFTGNQNTLKFISKNGSEIDEIDFDENIFSFYFDKMKNTQSDTLIIEYSSPIFPYKHFEIDLPTETKKIKENVDLSKELKKYCIPKVEEIYAISIDNVKIPIRILYNQDPRFATIKGVILKAYGAYGYREESDFNAEDIAYTRLGFVVAYAYVRGGGEMGGDWHAAGSLLSKRNTFEDYVNCAKYITQYYNISPKQLIGYGASAGGLIMGYVANNYPELFGVLIFDRPFLDPLYSMSDTTQPLTNMEFTEWGNPKNLVDYTNLSSYSPYQNIKPDNYPNMLFFSGLYDNQVPYWQVSKAVSKYRECNLSKSIILFNTNMSAGHKGSANLKDNSTTIIPKFALIMKTLATIYEK